MEGYVHSIETLGGLDGPGIRTVVFMQGCNARCIYCHNPDSWFFNKGKVYQVDEIVRIAKRSKPYYGKEGGVTFSGGEALAQGAFVLACAEKLKDQGISSVIDVSGTYVDDLTREVLKNMDLIILDIKHTKKDLFYKITGCSIDNLHQIINIIEEENIPVWIRQVIVPGLNDSENDILQLKSFVEQITAVKKVELLPFHQLGQRKWEELRLPYSLKDKEPLSEISLERLNAILQK